MGYLERRRRNRNRGVMANKTFHPSKLLSRETEVERNFTELYVRSQLESGAE